MLALQRVIGLCGCDPCSLARCARCLAGLRPLSTVLDPQGGPSEQASQVVGEGEPPDGAPAEGQLPADRNPEDEKQAQHLAELAAETAAQTAAQTAALATGSAGSGAAGAELRANGTARIHPPGQPAGAAPPPGAQAPHPRVPPPDPRPPAGPEGESTVMKAFRLHNSSMWGLEGQVVLGRVVQVTHDSVLVDVGFRGFNRFFKHELTGSQVFESGVRHRARGEDEFFVGDHLQVRIEKLESPYGNMYIGTQQLQRDLEMDQIWRELKAVHRDNIKVMGRILNPVNMGFAVGIAGYVGFLPLTQSGLSMGRLVGMLSPFHIIRMDDDRRSMVLQDANFAPVRRTRPATFGRWTRGNRRTD